jgi:hypothetical protein
MSASHDGGKLHLLDKAKLTIRGGTGLLEVPPALLGAAMFQHVKSCRSASTSAPLAALS